MGLVDDAMQTCTFLVETSQDDGYGGTDTAWIDGESFSAAFSLNTSVEARKAQAEGVNNLFTVFTSRDTVLTHGMVFRREGDGKCFRVTSDGTDKKTPPSAFLNLTTVSAEMWEVPNGQVARP